MQDNPRLGIALMIATTIVFAVQDGISRYLAENYNVITVVTIRYMFFICFVPAFSSRQKGGIRQVARNDQLPIQIGCGLLLVAQICVAILSFSTVGLVNFHTVFASYPLMVMALSVPILGEAVGWRRWLAVCVGFCGVLLILRPGTEMFSSASILPVLAAFMMAIYGILTRYAARRDPAETGSLNPFESVDEDFVHVNQFLKQIKLGFGKVTQQVSVKVRNKEITREEGLQLIRQYDGECSERLIRKFCDYLGIDRERFDEVTDKLRNRDLWQLNNHGEWELRFKPE